MLANPLLVDRSCELFVLYVFHLFKEHNIYICTELKRATRSNVTSSQLYCVRFMELTLTVFLFQVFDRYGGEEDSGEIRTRSKGEEQRDMVSSVCTFIEESLSFCMIVEKLKQLLFKLLVLKLIVNEMKMKL